MDSEIEPTEDGLCSKSIERDREGSCQHLSMHSHSKLAVTKDDWVNQCCSDRPLTRSKETRSVTGVKRSSRGETLPSSGCPSPDKVANPVLCGICAVSH